MDSVVDRATASPASAEFSGDDSDSGTASTCTSTSTTCSPSSTGGSKAIVVRASSKPARFTYTLNIAMELCRGLSLHGSDTPEALLADCPTPPQTLLMTALVKTWNLAPTCLLCARVETHRKCRLSSPRLFNSPLPFSVHVGQSAFPRLSPPAEVPCLTEHRHACAADACLQLNSGQVGGLYYSTLHLTALLTTLVPPTTEWSHWLRLAPDCGPRQSDRGAPVPIAQVVETHV